MWTMKQGVVSAGSLEFERYYLEENEMGVKLVLRKIESDGATKNAVEVFEYQEGDLSFEVLSSRVDQETLAMRDYYTVWLGVALNTVSIRKPADFITVDCGRRIAQNIKEALLVWRYPEKYAEYLSCRSSAQSVRFVMTGWGKWDPSFESNWNYGDAVTAIP